MSSNYSDKNGLATSELEAPAEKEIPLGEKIQGDVQDGDEALKILHTHFEPYTKEEERRVLRKIDLRLIIVMLIINGLQFVDKNVSSCPFWQSIVPV